MSARARKQQAKLAEMAKAAPAKTDAPKPEAAKPAAPEPKPEPKTPATPDAPKADAPKADAPKADAPKADAPKADAPKADAPKKTKADGEAPEGDAHARQQLTAVLGINISQARCATHLKQHLGDAAAEERIAAKRADYRAAVAAGNVIAATALKGEITAMAAGLVRISSETPVATAVVMDGIVKELLRFGMETALAHDRKIVDVHYLHSAGVEALCYYPLYSRLPTYAAYDHAREEALRAERAAANRAAREQKKAEAAKAGAPAPAAPAKDDDDDDDEEGHTKTTFHTYVENALKALKKEERYTAMRVSNRVREYLSTLVAEALGRVASISRVLVRDVANVRTMSADHVKAVVGILLTDAGRDSAAIAAAVNAIDAKLAVYHDHVGRERTKKGQAPADPAKAQADLRRKSEVAQKRAAEAAKTADALRQQVAALPADAPAASP